MSDVAPAVSTVTDGQLRAFLGHPGTQKRIRAIVAARVRGAAADNLGDDIVQTANLEALTSKSRPRSMDTAPGWLATITVRAIAHHLRGETARARFIDPESDVDGELTATQDDPEPDAGWLVSTWLAQAVAADPRDQETFELLLYKATTGKTNAEVAVDHGMTAPAFANRVLRFKRKYGPRYQRRRRALGLAILTGAITLALLAWLFWHPKPEQARPPRPQPSARDHAPTPPTAPPPPPPTATAPPTAPAPAPAHPDPLPDARTNRGNPASSDPYGPLNCRSPHGKRGPLHSPITSPPQRPANNPCPSPRSPSPRTVRPQSAARWSR